MRLLLLAIFVSFSFYVSASEVELLKAISAVGIYQRPFQEIDMSFRVKHFEGQRKVYIKGRYIQTQQEFELQAHFEKQITDEEELWTLHHSLSLTPVDLEFDVIYDIERGRFVDDHDGKHYHLKANEGVYLNEKNHVALVSSSFQASGSNPSYLYMNFQVAVRNLAYAKNVRIYYSRDSWRRSSTVEANFLPVWSATRGSIRSPNSYGIEMWEFHGYSSEVFYPGEEVTFYISYVVDGQEYFDNNFGRDYSVVLPVFN